MNSRFYINLVLIISFYCRVVAGTKLEIPVNRFSAFSVDTSLSEGLKGRVNGEDNMGLPGVSVMIKGSRQGTTTDIQGNFYFKKVNSSSTLIFSYIGYERKEVPVSTGRLLFVRLTRASNKLDEAVVIAYGTTTRRFNTSNIATVTADEISKQPVSNPLMALQGRVPGVVITPASGVAGGGVKVSIQGSTSLLTATAKNDPLYVIDGVPYTSQLLKNYGDILGTSGTQFTTGENGNPLNFINPADIERIDVLKDADATAIYGSRAANGAILITTKKGKSGKMQGNVNFQTGWSMVPHYLKMVGSSDYNKLRKESFNNSGIVPSSDLSNINYTPDLTFWDTTRYTNWQRELLGKSAPFTTANASVSGGTLTTSYLVGLTYGSQGSIFKSPFTDNIDRKGSGHANLNINSNDNRFHLSTLVSFMVDKNRLPRIDITSNVIATPPTAPALYNGDGSLNWMTNSLGKTTFMNPLAGLYSSYVSNTSNLLTNLQMSYEVFKGMSVKLVSGYNFMNANDYTFASLNSVAPDSRPNVLRSASTSNNRISNWSLEPQINYSSIVWRGKLDAIIGTSIQQENRNGLALIGTGFGSDVTQTDIRQAAKVNVDFNTISTYKYNALFGRINYILDEKYVLNLTARRDGSSRFGDQNRFHNFWSIGGAWILSSENWFKENINFFQYTKLRLSYGTTGNDQIGDYRYLSTYNPISYTSPYQGITSLNVSGIPNPYLQWEETRKLTAGLEFSIVNSRISANVNYTRNRSSNQLINYALPSTTGSGFVLRNFPGLVENSSWEAMLSSINCSTSNFKWTTAVNLTFPRNRLVRFDNIANSTYANTYVVGEPITGTKVYKFARVNPETGLYEQYDKNGNIATNLSVTDRTQFINLAPTFFGGLQNTFTYKGLSLDIFFQYTRQVSENDLKIGYGIPVSGPTNQPVDLLQRWQTKGDKAPIQQLGVSGNIIMPYINTLLSDYVYGDGSFLRLKNVSLSYMLPTKVTNRVNINSAKVYLQGQNIFTITKYKGLDPEIPNSLGLPSLRTIVLGCQILF
ncbi:MAG: SusC/RagA family TonB-linked outer membrane protein [Chitinophaga sp.]|uniref:SusC/RagA family TonB-linked outer membrane protein n=1 Tax=Chitinophaga sp. TaxID=1869181 RepID=UPI0025B7B3D6|nr:SusC/RagA family TonB-linked outer membrane protein [Chitinophaga sp.]MBV8253623.1 SusC/RagA family TonB-linked outer membrane protein [Chitinophaga sp.]